MAKFSEAKARKDYPQLAFLINKPEIRRLLKKRYEDSKYTDAKFQRDLQATKYWRQTRTSIKEYETLRATSPGELRARVRGKALEMRDIFRSLGAPKQKQMAGLARRALKMGWSDAELNDVLVNSIKYKASNLAGGRNAYVGQIGTLVTDIRSQANDYFLKIGNKSAFTWAKRMVKNELRPEDFKTYLQSQASGKFPHLMPFFKRGLTAAQVFESHKQEIATALEINPEQVNLMDRKWSPVLSSKDTEGNVAPMTISETQRYVRGLDEWKATRQGQETAANVGQTILERFGKVK